MEFLDVRLIHLWIFCPASLENVVRRCAVGTLVCCSAFDSPRRWSFTLPLVGQKLEVFFQFHLISLNVFLSSSLAHVKL